MARFDVSQIKNQPTHLLDFLKENRYGIFHRSNIFFRDFQYGLWRYLRKDQAKVPYMKIEELAREVIADWESKGIMKRIDRQTFELNMPAYSLIDPATLAAQESPTPPAQKAPVATPPKPATEAAAPAAVAPKPAAAPAAAATTGSHTPLTLWVPPGADDAKRAQIAELEAKMNDARARAASAE